MERSYGIACNYTIVHMLDRLSRSQTIDRCSVSLEWIIDLLFSWLGIMCARVEMLGAEYVEVLVMCFVVVIYSANSIWKPVPSSSGQLASCANDFRLKVESKTLKTKNSILKKKVAVACRCFVPPNKRHRFVLCCWPLVINRNVAPAVRTNNYRPSIHNTVVDASKLWGLLCHNVTHDLFYLQCNINQMLILIYIIKNGLCCFQTSVIYRPANYCACHWETVCHYNLWLRMIYM